MFKGNEKRKEKNFFRNVGEALEKAFGK